MLFCRSSCIGLAILAIGLPVGAAQVSFSDQTVSAGITFTPSSPVDMDWKEFYSGGSVGDFNRDGWPDLFLLGGGNVADALFVNNGNGTFTDHATDWGVGLVHRGRGATVGDFNRDGWPDLFVTSGGTMIGPDRVGQHLLYRNNGDGTFTDIAVSAGVNQASPTHTVATGATFGDYDLDGDLDLFVCTWEGMNGNRLFRNEGDETFTDVTTSAGIDQTFNGFSPRFVDMNGDRYPELLLAADYGTSRYYVNNQDGTFTDQTAASGTGLDENGMGTTVADFNRDGRPDWYVTSVYWPLIRVGNFVYVNQGNDLFSDLPESAGAKDGGWGWGTEALDFDHDGWIDIAETNGWWETTEWTGETAYLFRNNGDLTFSPVQNGSGFNHYGHGRSLLTLDYDRDGDMDIVVTSHADPVMLFRNDVSGPDANWIELKLDSSAVPALAPDGYGAKVTATAAGATQYFWLNGGSSYLGRSQPIVHFGLGSASLVDIVVEWADGSTTALPGLNVNQIVTAAPLLSGASGEASGNPTTQMYATFNRVSGEIEVDFSAACDASNHTIYYGDLANLPSYTYSGAACWVGQTGIASFDPGLANAFFVVVGNTGIVEGSYGLDGSSVERPQSIALAACDLPQDLTGTCDLP